MKSWKIILSVMLFLVFVSVGNCKAADVEQDMNNRLERENYYKQSYPPCPQVAEFNIIVNGKEYKSDNQQDGYHTAGSVDVQLELGTKVTSTALSWTIKNDKYITSQTLTIIDDKNQRTIIKFDPSVRTYIDKTPYMGAMRKDGFIFGRSYNLEIKDQYLGVDYAGTGSGKANINFRLKEYWGYSSKPILTDADINNMEGDLMGKFYNTIKSHYENLVPSGQYIYIIYSTVYGESYKESVAKPPKFRIKEGEPAKFNILDLPVYTHWDLTVQKHTNSAGFITDYNVYRTKEPLSGTYNFYKD